MCAITSKLYSLSTIHYPLSTIHSHLLSPNLRLHSRCIKSYDRDTDIKFLLKISVLSLMYVVDYSPSALK